MESELASWRDVKKFILACRRDEGIPMFKTRFAGQRFWGNGVLAVCWGGHDNVESKFFYGVPKEDLELIEESIGDWRKLLRKYGTPEELEEAESYGIYLKGYKLPRIVRR
ncbi:MAG TPA: hypothetical protein ENG13_04940 [bacterium]|nr:hypothetical protein [bacterium]HEX68392.1 hypothetical protein [bacterium]